MNLLKVESRLFQAGDVKEGGSPFRLTAVLPWKLPTAQAEVIQKISAVILTPALFCSGTITKYYLPVPLFRYREQPILATNELTPTLGHVMPS